jgi:hypothetical protein
MEILKLAVPAVTGMLGMVQHLRNQGRLVKVLTTALILLGGAGSAVLVHYSGKAEAQRANAAELARQRAEAKLDKMSDALLDIQKDLAALQVELARAPRNQPGAAATQTALQTAINKVGDAKGILRDKPAATEPAKTTPVKPPVSSPAAKPAGD